MIGLLLFKAESCHCCRNGSDVHTVNGLGLCTSHPSGNKPNNLSPVSGHYLPAYGGQSFSIDSDDRFIKKKKILGVTIKFKIDSWFTADFRIQSSWLRKAWKLWINSYRMRITILCEFILIIFSPVLQYGATAYTWSWCLLSVCFPVFWQLWGFGRQNGPGPKWSWHWSWL